MARLVVGLNFSDEQRRSSSREGADEDQDGMVNFGEYALGFYTGRIQNNNDRRLDELINGTNYLTLEFTVSASAVEANVTFQGLEQSGELAGWTAAR